MAGLEEHPSGGQSWMAGAGFGPDERSAFLSNNSPLLEGMAPDQLAELGAAFEVIHIAGDRQLISRDVPNDSLYVVVHGGLRVVGRDEHGHERLVSESYRGDSIGMFGLLPHMDVPADVFDIRDSTLLRLTRARFMALGARHPEFVMRLAEGIARRGWALIGQQAEWTTWARPRATPQNIAVLVPNRDRDFAQAAADLATMALGSVRPVERESRFSVDQALGDGASSVSPSDAGNERVLKFLQDLEARTDVVIYECDTTAAPWSERCLRQADRVLAILRAGRPEHAEEIRAWLEPMLSRHHVPQIDLALVHDEQAEVPGGSPADWGWLPQSAHVHHVRMDNRADYERLARTLLRSGVAVVLSGGGARGIAHVGVLKALEEARVPIDAIAGTSMGAIMAAGYARGWSADTLFGHVRELFRHRMALYDPRLPLHALLAGRKLERVLRLYFEGLDIWNLWLPFFCISTNLSRAEPRVHERGDLWRAVAASCSIPGIFPPRREGNDQLVDGGIMNNMPVDVMADRFGGTIIASDVSGETDVTGDGESPSPPARDARWRELLGRLRPRRAQADRGPGIFEILTQSTMVGGRHTLLLSMATGRVSLHLRLPVRRFGMLDWAACDELHAAGYDFARQQLAAWQPPSARAARDFHATTTGASVP